MAEEKKERMSAEDARALLTMWGDALDINTETTDFSDACDVLIPAVRSERLAYDEDAETFSLKLSAPLVLQAGKREMLTIKELTLDEKRGIEKFKDSEKISMVEAIYAKAAGLSLAEASKIKGRDFSVVSAICTVFFS
jgi:hypothetical protein